MTNTKPKPQLADLDCFLTFQQLVAAARKRLHACGYNHDLYKKELDKLTDWLTDEVSRILEENNESPF